MRLYIILLLLLATSCKKEWLEEKPDIKLVVPETVEDYQALLDHQNFQTGQLAFGEVGVDDYYVSYNSWQFLQAVNKFAYVWDKDIYHGDLKASDWELIYSQVLTTNIILEGIDKTAAGAATQSAWNNVKGSALFHRSTAFYNAAQLFAKPYTVATAAADPGIPLRLSADVNERSARGTVQQTYDRILNDLRQSIPLLPDTAAYKTRPSKAAAYGMLARVYLQMEDYDKCLRYADSSLQLGNALLDYSTLDTIVPYSFPWFTGNPEIVFFEFTSGQYTSLNREMAIVDSVLYRSYLPDDLRKATFFRKTSGNIAFTGSYHSSGRFTGIARDELYLMRAECYARAGNTAAAMKDLNTLLEKRWRPGTFKAFTAADAEDALRQILAERRKELCFRALRWSDLRRLNKDPRFAVTLKRVLNGETYTLPPNDPRYVLPIPLRVIELSGIQQNER